MRAMRDCLLRPRGLFIWVSNPEKRPLMEILPEAFAQCLALFRPLLRAEVYLTFTYLVTGLLVGEAKWGAVRASVLAPADYQPARTSALFTTQRVSPQRLLRWPAALA